MATTNFSRSRSPVLSIRTQPEEEDNLRAEIEAASRTQHEILPRYSWQSTFVKRETNPISRRGARPSLPRELPPSQLARSTTVDDYGSDEEQLSTSHFATTIPHKHTENSRISLKPWKRLTKRTKHSHTLNSDLSGPITNDLYNSSTSRRKSSNVRRRGEEVVADADREAQQAQFNAWLAERMEERNTLPKLSQTLPPRTKRAIRKSVYGSLSSTKSFLKGASKSPLEKLCGIAANNLPVTPHVYSFETKDQLRDYFNNGSVVSPSSPAHYIPQPIAIGTGDEPVELSAGPLPAELECNSAGTSTQTDPPLSRTSTPSIGDLPPYIDDKKFGADMAKHRAMQSDPSLNELSEELRNVIQSIYNCSSCQRSIHSYEVYDFCAICDTGDRVLCIDCAKRGPCCQHELEELLRACSLDQECSSSSETHCEHAELRHSEINKRSDLDPCGRNGQENLLSNRVPFLELQAAEQASSLHIGSDATGLRSQFKSDFKNLQAQFLNEMNYLRREQDIVHRERELGLRAREIEVRDQQTTLREREVVMQQKSDMLIRNLETLVSYQQLAKSTCFNESEQKSTFEEGRAKAPYDSGTRMRPEHAKTLINSNQNETDESTPHTIDDAMGPSIQKEQISKFEYHSKSHGVSKRKKETSGGSSVSTPAAASSPEQSHKSISRGNSDRSDGRDDEEDGEDRRYPKKHKQEPSSPIGPQLLFACPFSKHDPFRYSSRNMVEKNYRGCEGHFLTDVSRLKQHLKRVHWQPETYCPRCFEEFENSATLAAHARAQIACPTRECPFPEKMDKTKQDKIHVKRPRVPPETVWYDIFKALFPGSPLPESPYIEKDDRVTTPSSAVPPGSTNVQAMQQLTDSFTQKLNQHPELQGSHLRPLISQALVDSFAELLGTFSLSATASPAPGPSIVVSPVSRISRPSSHTGTSANIPSVSAHSPHMEQRNPMTDIARELPHVPLLQQPRPPKLQLNTKLQVPPDPHRSPSNANARGSPSSACSADVIFDINIPAHVREDQGYDDECRSFEQGDDLEAMAFVNEPSPPSFRNKSVMSIDSGYGSGRSQQPRIPSTSDFMAKDSDNVNCFDEVTGSVQDQRGTSYVDQSYTTQTGQGFYDERMTFKHNKQPDYMAFNNKPFESYSNFFDAASQEEMLSGIDFPLMDHTNPWLQP